MRAVTILSLRTIAAALAGGLVLAVSASGAQAYDHRRDRDHWDRWHHDHHHYDHRRFVEERPVVIREHRPVVVERPVMMVPPMMYQQPQGPSGLNLNFNIPLN